MKNPHNIQEMTPTLGFWIFVCYVIDMHVLMAWVKCVMGSTLQFHVMKRDLRSERKSRLISPGRRKSLLNVVSELRQETFWIPPWRPMRLVGLRILVVPAKALLERFLINLFHHHHPQQHPPPTHTHHCHTHTHILHPKTLAPGLCWFTSPR